MNWALKKNRQRMPTLEALRAQLDAYLEKGLKRTLRLKKAKAPPYITIDGHTLLHCCNNDYLGLSHHPEVIKAACIAAQTYGVGGQSSPMVAGHSALHDALCTQLAAYYGQEDAILFASGYQANAAMIHALIDKNDRIFHDKYNHASLVRTLTGGQYNHKRFVHKDYQQLQTLLNDQPNTDATWIISDTIFSMLGDAADIQRLDALAKGQHAYLLLDNTHGTGVIDPLKGIHFETPLCISTGFGKALGSQGGAVIGPKVMIEAIRQWAPQFMFSTALAPPLVAAALKSLEIIKKESARLERLQANIALFKDLCQQKDVALLPSNTPIQIVPASDGASAAQWSAHLQQEGCFVHAILPPTIPGNKGCLRLLINHDFTEAHIAFLVEKLSSLPKR